MLETRSQLRARNVIAKARIASRARIARAKRISDVEKVRARDLDARAEFMANKLDECTWDARLNSPATFFRLFLAIQQRKEVRLGVSIWGKAADRLRGSTWRLEGVTVSMRLWALLILVVALVANAVDDDITCHQSGMCSVGKVKHFYGTVATSEGFLTAMESVSYKREVVLVTTFGSYYLEFVFQLHSQFKKLAFY
eukprot:gene17552-23876_t